MDLQVFSDCGLSPLIAKLSGYELSKIHNMMGVLNLSISGFLSPFIPYMKTPNADIRAIKLHIS